MRLPRLALLLAFGVAVAATSATAQAPRTIKPEAKDAAADTGAYANSWALVVGINAYQKVTPRLNYAVADAKAVAEALPGLGFPRQNIRVLLNADATKAKIEHVLYREFAKMGAQDRLLVFFAGHGETARTKSGDEGYLLPVDADPTSLPLTAIPMDEVRRIGNRVSAKHVLFVMDACFSGFAITRDVVPAATTDEYLASALREPAVQVMTAGRKGERAIEEGEHGLFTRRFLDGLRGLADTEGRGVITAAQLAAWIEPRVVRDSKGKMTPQYGKLDGEGQFVFLMPGAQIAKIQPGRSSPPPLIHEETRRAVTLAGTKWSGRDSDGDLWEIEFTSDGHLQQITNRRGPASSGTWKLEDDAIYIEVNNRYAEYKGIVRGNIMEGTAANANGHKWRWNLRRMDRE